MQVVPQFVLTLVGDISPLREALEAEAMSWHDAQMPDTVALGCIAGALAREKGQLSNRDLCGFFQRLEDVLAGERRGVIVVGLLETLGNIWLAYEARRREVQGHFGPLAVDAMKALDDSWGTRAFDCEGGRE